MGKIKNCFINIIPISLLLAGCLPKKELKIYESGYFKYSYLTNVSSYLGSKGECIVIMGFTDSGLEQEVLEVPEEIDGYKVERIGIDNAYYDFGGYLISCSKNLKRLFISKNIKFIDYFSGKKVDLFINSSTKSYENITTNFNTIYLYKDVFVELGYPESYKRNPKQIQRFKAANVNFFKNLNNSDDDLYRIDHINDDEKIDKPNDPFRDGFSFDGWYLDSECTQKFDFNIVPDFCGNDVINLYAGWNTKI